MKRRFPILIILATLFLACLTLTGCFGLDDVPVGEPHTITVLPTENGQVIVDKTTARKNEYVAVKIIPHEDYEAYYFRQNGTTFWGDGFKMPGEDVVIDVRFRERLYYIKYHYNSYAGERIVDTGEDYYRFDEGAQLSIAFKEGYQFQGWYEQETPDVVYKNIPIGTKGDMDFYPKFEPTQYTLDFHMPEGAEHNNPSTYTVEDESFELTPATMENYHFLYWCTDEALTRQISYIDASEGGHYRLYPVFYSELYDEDGYRLITSATDFREILEGSYNEQIEGNYRLANDIDAKGVMLTSYNFSGVFDGANHKITGLSFEETAVNGTTWALFKETHFATIKNFSIEIDAKLTKDSPNGYPVTVGGVIGECSSSVIENVHLEKFHMWLETNITYRVGGLVAWVDDWTDRTVIRDCTAKDIQIFVPASNASGWAGALAGVGVDVIRSSAEFEEDDYIYICGGRKDGGTLYLGGLVGEGTNSVLQDSYVFMHDGSYFRAHLNNYYGDAYLGGLMGYNFYTGREDSYVKNCYARISKMRVTAGGIKKQAFIAVAGLVAGNMDLIENSFLAVGSNLEVDTPSHVNNSNVLTNDAYEYVFGLLSFYRQNDDNYGKQYNLYTNAGGIDFADAYVGKSSIIDQNYVAKKELSAIYAILDDVWDTSIWDFSEDYPTLIPPTAEEPAS